MKKKPPQPGGVYIKIKRFLKKTHINCVFYFFKRINLRKVIIFFLIVLVLFLTAYDYAISYYKYNYFISYMNDDFVIRNISGLIYSVLLEKDFKIEKLKQDIELSKIQENRAKNIAKKEASKRDKAEVAKKEAQEKVREKSLKIAKKEAQEKRMNVDNDKDGLSYREELSQNTSDFNSDSDNDGIIDSKDIHPAGGGRNIPQAFSWDYGGYNWNWVEVIQEDWYDYYKAKDRGSHPSIEYVTTNDPFIKKIAKSISESSEDDVNEVWLAVSFVQNLSYVEDIFTGYDEYPKYPIETFFEKNGDCEDTSYLAASIISAMGYDVALVVLPGHMAIAVSVDCDIPGMYYEIDNNCYYYIETTSNSWVAGEMPSKYYSSHATLIKNFSGEKEYAYPQYKEACYASTNFSGYYYDGDSYYLDSGCKNITYCLFYEGVYYNYKTENFFWDNNCTKKIDID